jgi:hypothetical protein
MARLASSNSGSRRLAAAARHYHGADLACHRGHHWELSRIRDTCRQHRTSGLLEEAATHSEASCALSGPRWASVRRRSLEPLAFSRTDSLPREPDAGQDPPDGGCGQLAHGSRSARPACSVRDRLNRSRRCDSRSAAAEQIAFGPRSSRCRCPIRRRRRNDLPSDHLREEKHTHACQEGRIKHVRH